MRKITSLTIAFVLTATLTACASETTLPEPKVQKTAEYVFEQDKFTSIAKQAQTAIEKADTQLDKTLLQDRVAGLVLSQREAQYELKKIVGANYILPSIGISPDATIIASGKQFPRSLATITEPNDAQNFQTLQLWSLDAPREALKLWGQVYLFPGLDVPSLKSNLSNVAGYSKNDAKKYLATPDEVSAAYVKYLTTGETAGTSFTADDNVYIAVKTQKDRFATAVADLGSVALQASARENVYRTVPTENGGMIALTEITYDLSVTRQDEEATLRLRGDIGAWAANESGAAVDVKDVLTATYGIQVAFYIPASGSKEKVKVIGAGSPTLSAVSNE